jgi:hypothetical protein
MAGDVLLISNNRWPCCNGKTRFKPATLDLHDVWQIHTCPDCNRKWRLRVIVSEYLTIRMGVRTMRIEWQDPREAIHDGAA